MNEHELENLLTSLAPARPGTALAQRVDRELEQDMQWALRPTPRRAVSWLPPVFWTSLGAAAAVLVMSLTPTGGSSATDGPVVATTSVLPSGTVPALLPVSTIREIVDAQDEGIRYNAESHLPEQHMKIVSLERRAWIDPRDGAHITVEVPSEDSVILPVAFQ